MNTKFIASLALVALAPVAAHAETLEDTLQTIGDLINLATPIVVAIGLLFFFWGLGSMLMSAGGDKGDGKKARDNMIWGILILFVMMSVWGLVAILQDTFNVGGNQQITPPSVNTN